MDAAYWEWFIGAKSSPISCSKVATTISSLSLFLNALVAALLHDIGDEFAPMNHSQYAASVLRPYVSEKTHWIVEKHGLFQTYYSAEHLGGDKNARDKYKDHQYYQATIDFCEKYDQCSFDPNYKSMSLKEFEPMVRKIFSRKPFYHH